MEVKFIHTGDLHLGLQFENASFSLEYANKRRIELWETFERIIDRVKKNNIDILIIAGDLFEDEYCSIGDIKRINSTLKGLSDTRIIITAGNHDSFGEKSLYKAIEWSENIYVFQGENMGNVEFEDINTIVWGVSWEKKEEKRNLVDDIAIEKKDKTNILVVHGDTLNKNSTYLPIDKDKISHFDYVALGHIHKPQFISHNIAYCGSPEPLDFGEQGEHGIIEGNISNGQVVAEFVPFNKREFIIKEITLDENMDYNDIKTKITSCDDNDKRSENLYRIILKGLRDSDIKIDIGEMQEVLKNKFNYLEIIDKTKPDYDIERIEQKNKDNIIGAFIRDMKKKGLDNPIIKDALYEGLEVLLSEKVKI